MIRERGEVLIGVASLNIYHIIPCLKLFPKQARVFTRLQYKSFENTVGKGELASNKQFLLFPQCFIPVWRTFNNCYQNLKLWSAMSFSLEESKICRLGKG